MTARPTQEQPVRVSETTKQAGEIRARWAWVEATVWTERMLTLDKHAWRSGLACQGLTALETGVKGGVWFSLMDKVERVSNLRSALDISRSA